MRSSWISLFLVVLTCFAACTKDQPPSPGADSGRVTDGGETEDSGGDAGAVQADAAPRVDAAEADATTSVGDASAESDASSPTADAGFAPDATAQADAAVIADAGMPPDGGKVCTQICAQGGAPGPATAGSLATLVADIAAAQCRALFRCCNAADQREFFGPIRQDGDASWALASFRPRLPPDAPSFTEQDCVGVMTEILAIQPFGPWVQAAQAGNVGFDLSAAQACFAALDGATCGPALASALYDSTCFSFSPPGGGTEQRRMFQRSASAGPCDPIPDGTGGRVFGTCDPTSSFCCFRAPGVTSGACWVAGGGRVGTCAPAAMVGQSCGIDFQQRSATFCATGLYCDLDTGLCARDVPMSLVLGDTCYRDQSILGQCPPQAYCDVLGGGACLAQSADGEACSSGDQCLSGACR